MICPCCGLALPDTGAPTEYLLKTKLTKEQKKILKCLLDAYPSSVTRDDLIEHLWGRDRDGGPDRAWEIVYSYVFRLRLKLERIGWTVPRNSSGRSGTAFYRLVKLQ
jgi:DNA-binding response OmpR family regulator